MVPQKTTTPFTTSQRPDSAVHRRRVGEGARHDPGADNGIGMASALAVLADDSVEHGPLEVLLTMTEEAGMDGAFGLRANWLQADILINTDSEEEGEIYMGCAGGIDFISTLPLSREAIPAGFETFKLTLKGLKGGHSGGDIHGHGQRQQTAGAFHGGPCR